MRLDVACLSGLAFATGFSASCLASEAEKSFDLQCGVLSQVASRTWRVKEETTRIPKHLKEMGFKFGCLIYEKSNKTFKLQTVVRLPVPPRVVGPGFIDLDSAGGLRGAPATREGQAAVIFSFDRDDPIGLWKLEIHVDDKLLRTFEFTVYEPEQPAAKPTP